MTERKAGAIATLKLLGIYDDSVFEARYADAESTVTKKVLLAANRSDIPPEAEWPLGEIIAYHMIATNRAAGRLTDESPAARAIQVGDARVEFSGTELDSVEQVAMLRYQRGLHLLIPKIRKVAW